MFVWCCHHRNGSYPSMKTVANFSKLEDPMAKWMTTKQEMEWQMGHQQCERRIGKIQSQ